MKKITESPYRETLIFSANFNDTDLSTVNFLGETVEYSSDDGEAYLQGRLERIRRTHALAKEGWDIELVGSGEPTRWHREWTSRVVVTGRSQSND